MFTLWNYIALGVIALVLLSIGFALGFAEFSSKRQKILIVIIEIVLIAGIIIGCGFYNTHTESGKRALKTWDSEKGGGLHAGSPSCAEDQPGLRGAVRGVPA